MNEQPNEIIPGIQPDKMNNITINSQFSAQDLLGFKERILQLPKQLITKDNRGIIHLNHKSSF